MNDTLYRRLHLLRINGNKKLSDRVRWMAMRAYYQILLDEPD